MEKDIEILEKYINLINKGYCDDCNELNCIDNFPHKEIAQALKHLIQAYKKTTSRTKKERQDNKRNGKEIVYRRLLQRDKLQTMYS